MREREKNEHEHYCGDHTTEPHKYYQENPISSQEYK